VLGAILLQKTILPAVVNVSGMSEAPTRRYIAQYSSAPGGAPERVAERQTGCFPERRTIPADVMYQPFTPNSLFNFLLFSAEQLLLLAKGTSVIKAKQRQQEVLSQDPEIGCSIWIVRCLAAITVIAKS
jgi:hypothetical protein